MNKYSTFGWRILASFVDGVVMVPVAAPFMLVEFEIASWAYWFSGLGLSVIGNAYNILLHWRYGQTLGKMAVGLRVVDHPTEGPLTFSQAVLRDLPNMAFQVLSSVAIFYLLISGIDPQAEAYKIAETYPTYGLFAFMMVNVFVCITNVQNRAVHDMLASTVVIRLGVEEAVTAEPPKPDEYDEFREDRSEK